MKCFVIMPISNHPDYDDGHFKRVYEHIIKPACVKAGFEPIRADEVLTTNHIAIDIIKNIIKCEMAICDLSSKNPNVLYELGIRQAFNLPVTLLKDDKTDRIFDIQEFRDVAYDHTLRIDNVNETILALSEMIKNTYANKNEINSLISLLGIEEARITKETVLSADTTVVLNMLQNLDTRLYDIENTLRPKESISNITVNAVPSNLGEYIKADELDTLKAGDEIFHNRFGIGVVQAVTFRGDDLSNTAIEVSFKVGKKTLVFGFAKLRKVERLHE